MDTSHYSTRPVTFSQLLLYYYLPNNIHSAIRLFADDCVLYRKITNASDSQELQKYLNLLMKWE